MYVCLCNPFSDKSVQKFLVTQDNKVTVSGVYKECSGGQSPQCRTCIDQIKDMVREHNRKVTVRNLSTPPLETIGLWDFSEPLIHSKETEDV
jgi:bacterioferritin-associated ferredoxin